MTPDALSMQSIACGLHGTLGQGVRVIAGLKEAHDSTAQQNQPRQIESGTLTISLPIGFAAGALALLITSRFSAVSDADKSTASSLIAVCH
ncbi:MAG TPA: hypothetical protein VFW53_00525 [Gallionella sp.]|nr:hypothetical protein [Gallionella sp.]